jgi:hypothetical protein
MHQCADSVETLTYEWCYRKSLRCLEMLDKIRPGPSD